MKKYLIIAGLLAATAVILGALGAHGLRNHLDAVQINSFLTGVRYQFYHVFAILISCILYKQFGQKQFLIANHLFFAGIILFSGSIYILSTKTVTGFDLPSFFGLLTPLGGLVFIGGWILFIIGALGINRKN